MLETDTKDATLEQKLDLILEEIHEIRQYRLALEDLRDDLTLVAKAALSDATRALGESDLGASLPHLLGIVRQITRPESVAALEVILEGFGDVQRELHAREQEVSWAELVRDLRSPEAKRGLAVLTRFLRTVGGRHAGAQ